MIILVSLAQRSWDLILQICAPQGLDSTFRSSFSHSVCTLPLSSRSDDIGTQKLLMLWGLKRRQTRVSSSCLHVRILAPDDLLHLIKFLMGSRWKVCLARCLIRHKNATHLSLFHQTPSSVCPQVVREHLAQFGDAQDFQTGIISWAHLSPHFPPSKTVWEGGTNWWHICILNSLFKQAGTKAQNINLWPCPCLWQTECCMPTESEYSLLLFSTKKQKGQLHNPFSQCLWLL